MIYFILYGFHCQIFKNSWINQVVMIDNYFTSWAGVKQSLDEHIFRYRNVVNNVSFDTHSDLLGVYEEFMLTNF